MVKTTENEFRSQAVTWLNTFLDSGRYPFEVATNDPSIQVSGTAKFPDIQIWFNRKAKQGFCGWELKTPSTPADDKELLENAAEKARAMHADYFVTWNMRDAIIWRTPQSGVKIVFDDRVKTYPCLHQILSADDLWIESKKSLLKTTSKQILDDLAVLYVDGHLHQVALDSTYFVSRLRDTVEYIFPHIQKSLMSILGKDAKFKSGLFGWASKQGIANYNDASFFETVSRQIVYRLLSRIIFYETLRRHWNTLPLINLAGLDAEKAGKELNINFQKAKDIDWHAVFEPDFTDGVPIPMAAIEEIDRLTQDLNRYNFGLMPQDVIGSVFEKLIPQQERRLLGQYFTPEDLVDLISAFCVRTVDDLVLDPTCGTGTFLNRAYNKMRTQGQKEHKQLLSQIWGIDIAHFPAQLATINLFRQDLSDFANFPRVICQDTFTVKTGQLFKFPPPKANPGNPLLMIQEKLPVFDAAIGNFPFIRQEKIEKTNKDYKKLLEKTLAEDWLFDYPEVFTSNGKPITKNVLKVIKKSKKPDFSTIDLKLSGQADIYAYLFFHVAKLLKAGGRMGFITSNSWLDVAYGFELQKFMLEHFKVVAVLESRCEPWFEDAAINTIVTVLERCSSREERTSNVVKFVKLKKPLKELIPWDMTLEASQRWFGLDSITHKIEASGEQHFPSQKETVISGPEGIKSYEDGDFRIRAVNQEGLLNELTKEGKTAKWGKYLRTPDVYFDIQSNSKVDLPPLSAVAKVNRGITTNNVEFFYLTPQKIEHWAIESKFIVGPVIYSPKEMQNIILDKSKLRYSIFVCNVPKNKLLGTHALKYIQAAEARDIHKSQTFKGKKDWYQLGEIEKKPGSLFYARQADKFRVVFNPEGIVTNDNVYTIVPNEGVDNELLCAVLNSSFFALGLELNGRVNLGEGALKVQTYELGDTKLLSPNGLVKKQKSQIVKAFRSIKKRDIKTIDEELKLPDRIKLDKLILKAMGLNPDIYIKPLYEGIRDLVRERIQLGEMRKSDKKAKITRDTEGLKKQVVEEVLPGGIKKFPEAFLEKMLKIGEYENVSIPVEALRLGYYFMGTQEVVSDNGVAYKGNSIEEAKYVIYSQKPDTYTISVPKDSAVITKVVTDYEIYLDELTGKLTEALLTRTFDHRLSETLAESIVNQLVPSGRLPSISPNL